MKININNIIIAHELGHTADFRRRDKFYNQITKRMQWSKKSELSEMLVAEVDGCAFEPATGESVLERGILEKDIKTMRENSYAHPFFLRSNILKDVLNVINNLNFYNRFNNENLLGSVIKDMIRKKDVSVSGTYWLTGGMKDHDQVLAAGIFQKIAFDPNILTMVGKYLGATPIHVATNLCFSTPTNNVLERSMNVHQYHQDCGFVNSVKVFIYLTDTYDENGPHYYIAASNRKDSNEIIDGYFESKLMTDDELALIYGKENIRSIEGKAGTIAFGDISCFHKDGEVKKGARLVIGLEYTNSLFGASVNYFNTEINQNLISDYSTAIKNRIQSNYDPHKSKSYDAYQKSVWRKVSLNYLRLKQKILKQI